MGKNALSLIKPAWELWKIRRGGALWPPPVLPNSSFFKTYGELKVPCCYFGNNILWYEHNCSRLIQLLNYWSLHNVAFLLKFSLQCRLFVGLLKTNMKSACPGAIVFFNELHSSLVVVVVVVLKKNFFGGGTWGHWILNVFIYLFIYLPPPPLGNEYRSL